MKREPCDTGTLLVKSKAKVKRQEEAKGKRYSMDDITVNRRVFRKVFIPLYIDFMMTTIVPFEIHDDHVIPEFQKIFNSVFPYDKQQITEEDPIKYVVCRSIMP